MPVLNVYALIQWTLKGKSEGHGYGFPFDRPHLAFAKRIHHLHGELEKLKTIKLRGVRKDNKPYFKVYLDLEKIIKDRTLWKTVAEIEEKITVFEKLRKAMRIARTSGRHGLNDEGQTGNIRTIDGIDYRYLVRVPDDLCVIVAGGGNGGLTAVVPTHVYNVPPGDLVTRKINRV